MIRMALAVERPVPTGRQPNTSAYHVVSSALTRSMPHYPTAPGHQRG
jgi:hypothetical protein